MNDDCEEHLCQKIDVDFEPVQIFAGVQELGEILACGGPYTLEK